MVPRLQVLFKPAQAVLDQPKAEQDACHERFRAPAYRPTQTEPY